MTDFFLEQDNMRYLKVPKEEISFKWSVWSDPNANNKNNQSFPPYLMSLVEINGGTLCIWTIINCV